MVNRVYFIHMKQIAARPFEVDHREYPFDSKWHATPEGNMHYIDEGRGDVLLFVHGTPVWSFLYRNIIRHFSQRFRCIAVDHLGFGLSEKRPGMDYRPQAHARRLEALIEALGLQKFTLVVHDFGGPIGLAFAIRHPERIEKIVHFNTWMWSNAGDPNKVKLAKLIRSPIGKFLYLRLNFSARFIVKMAFHDKSKLTPSIHAQYTRPFPGKAQREAPLVLGQELLSDWFETLWSEGARIRHLPALVVWGMQDPAFGKGELERWEKFWEHATIMRIENCGHFPQEEALPEVLSSMEAFLTTAASDG